MKQLFAVVQGNSKAHVDGKTFEKKQDAKALRDKHMAPALMKLDPKSADYDLHLKHLYSDPNAFKVVKAKDHIHYKG